MSPKRKETESGSTSDHPTKKARLQIDLEELLEQSQSRQNEAEETDNSFSPIEREITSKSQHDFFKTISIVGFRVAMPMSNPNTVFRDVVLECQLGKPFNKFKSIMKKENIDGLFKKSCFVYFIELSGARPFHFPVIMVYGLLKRKIKYAGNDGEFAIVTSLRCDRLEEPLIKKTPYKGFNKCKVKKDRLLGIVGPSYKVEDLMADLKNKDIPKHYKEKLCLVWFVHSVLLARDVRKVIEHDLLAVADDFGKFNDYSWGYDSYYLTVKYLLKKLKPKTTTLYSFPWAFMKKKMPISRIAIGNLGEATKPDALKSALAEFICMIFFVFPAEGCVILFSKLIISKETTAMMIAISISHGFPLFVAVAVGLNISGGHVNPAVTFGAFVGGHITFVRSILYWIAQLLGSVSAIYLLKFATNGLEVTAHPPASPWHAVLYEIILTFLLVYTYYATTLDPKRGKMGIIGPIAIGLICSANILSGGTAFGAAMNPAMSFCQAVISKIWTNHWVYWLGHHINNLSAGGLGSVGWNNFYHMFHSYVYHQNSTCSNINISGGHVNPTVTFGAFVGGHITFVRSILYWIAQLLGSVSAIYLLKFAANGLEVTAHPASPWYAVLYEIILTFLLVYTYYATTIDPKRGKMGIIGPIAIGLICSANILSGGTAFGAAMNPAMSFCQAVISKIWTNHWVYWLGTFVGGAIAGTIYQTIFIDKNTDEELPTINYIRI
ncbi:Aquaporin TIP1-2 [Capsicum annuum]|uniref:Aquaporin TIP1-2 n=1 Tax=Capsicum annuum TaxID=4072 RepID=A0A2G2YGN2_CAPAN|nr:Aquaporin TIP1-2 [Capsicum annuum]